MHEMRLAAVALVLICATWFAGLHRTTTALSLIFPTASVVLMLRNAIFQSDTDLLIVIEELASLGYAAASLANAAHDPPRPCFFVL